MYPDVIAGSGTCRHPVLPAVLCRRKTSQGVDTACSASHQKCIMKLPRRSFLHLAAGAAALPAASQFSWAQVSPTTPQRVRAATGLLATWQSTAWLGAEAGVFKNRGVYMSLPAIAVGGPEAAA